MFKKTVSVLLAVLMVFGILPLGAVSALAAQTDTKAAVGNDSDYPELTVGQTTQATFERDGENELFYIVKPEQEVACVFYTTGDYDTKGTLYDSEWNELEENEDYTTENFRVQATLEAGQTYYFGVKLYGYNFSDEDSITVDFHCDVCGFAESMRIEAVGSLDGYVGTKVYLNVVFLPENSAEEDVSWLSSNNDVAKIDTEYGEIVVLLKKAGTATITATSERGLVATCTITARDFDTIAAGETKNVEISEGGASAYFKFVPDETATYTFFSSGDGDTYGYLLDKDMDIISYNDDGGEDNNFKFVEELTAGETYIIRARLYGEDKTGSFTVTALKNVDATGVAIVGGDVEGRIGEHRRLTAKFLPDGAFEEEVDWSSSDSSVASIDDGGYLELKAVGTAVITATSAGGLTASINVTVNDYETLSPGETKSAANVNPNETVTYKIVPHATGNYAIWAKSNGDTYGTLLNADMDCISEDDDSGSSLDFRISETLIGGTVYYLQVKFCGTSTGWFSVSMEETSGVTGLSLVSLPYNTTCYEGAIDSTLDLSGLALRITWSDGEVINWKNGDGYTVRGEKISIIRRNNVISVQCGGKSVSFEITVVENPVDYIEIEGDVTVIEEIDGEWRPDGDDGWYFYYYLGIPLGDVDIVVRYKDGSSAVTHIGEKLNGISPSYYDSQYRKPLTLGSDNTVTVSYLGKTADVTVTVVENPVAKIEIIGDPKVTLLENNDGDYRKRYNEETGRYEEYFYYYTFNIPDVPVRITYKDGTVKEAYCGDRVDGQYINAQADQEETPWTVGSDNLMYVSYMGRQAALYVTIEENPVLRLELVKPSSNVLIENADGYITTRYDAIHGDTEFFYYSLSRLDDALVRIVFKNGETVTAQPDDYVNGHYVDTGSNQYGTPFTVGDNPYYISYLGIRCEATATVVPNPVEGIEILDGYTLNLIEEADGFWSTRENAQGETTPYFYYYIPSFKDMRVRVRFTDGTTEIISSSGELMGYELMYNQDQYHTPWTAGGENYLTVSFMGRTAQIPVVIEPNPVESIQVAKNTARTLVENGDGYWYNRGDGSSWFDYEVGDISDAEIKINYVDGTSKTARLGDKVDGYRVNYNTNQYEEHWSLGSNNFVTVSFMGRTALMPITIVETPIKGLVIDRAPSKVYVYDDEMYGGKRGFYPSELAGLKFTVTYKNGTTKTFTDADIKDGNRIDDHIFDFECSRDQVVGQMPVTFSYMGLQAEYNVTVRENNIKKLEVVKLPTVPVYSKYYDPDFSGMQVKITKTDGSSRTVTLSNDNIIYAFSGTVGYYIGFEFEGTICCIGKEQNYEKKYYLSCAGVTCDIAGLTYREDKEVVGVELENFSLSAENMLVKATYADGTSENIRLTEVKDNRLGWVREVYNVRALTSKGLLTFQITNPEYAEYMEYDVYILGQKVIFGDAPVPVYIRGDVTGDGKVTVDDATRLQSWLAEFSVPNTAQLLKCGDANNDGKIDVKDVTAIQRYIADAENIYHIGEAI